MDILNLKMSSEYPKEKKTVTSYIIFDRVGEIDTMNETYKAFVTIGQLNSLSKLV